MCFTEEIDSRCRTRCRNATHGCLGVLGLFVDTAGYNAAHVLHSQLNDKLARLTSNALISNKEGDPVADSI